MGIRNALSAERRILDFLHGELQRVLPNATWTAAGIGRHQTEVMGWALERNGDGVRTGLEDNIRTGKDRLAQATPSSCGSLARRVPSMAGALPHRPKPGRCFDSDADVSVPAPGNISR